MINITIKIKGRVGYINYQEDENCILIEYEISGVKQYDILLVPIDLRKWTKPKGINISKFKQIEIFNNLQSWIKEQNIKTDIPLEIQYDNKDCIIKGCSKKRVKDFAYCLEHQFLVGK